MAILNMLLFMVIIVPNILVNSELLQSMRYMKFKNSPYSVPIDECYARKIGGKFRSIVLRCEDSLSSNDPNSEYGGRDIVAYKYTNEDCTGQARAIERFDQG